MSTRRCPQIVSAAEALTRAGVPFLLVHEAAIMAMGLDYNIFLGVVDACVSEADAARWGEAPTDVGEFLATKINDTGIRIWTPKSLGLPSRRVRVRCERYGCWALDPELVLRVLPLSPDFPGLAEQRARLAEVLYHDRMTDDELLLFSRYVRGR